MERERDPAVFVRQKSQSSTTSMEMQQPVQERKKAKGGAELVVPSITRGAQEDLLSAMGHQLPQREELVATIRHEQEIKTAKLTNRCKNSHSEKIVLKHANFMTILYLIPKALEPGNTSEIAQVMIYTEVKQNLQRMTEQRSEICKILVTTEVCDKDSGRRLEDQNRCPHSKMNVLGGNVRYTQDLVPCGNLNVARYRNGSVKVVFKIQLFVMPNFKYSCRINEDGEVEINCPNLEILEHPQEAAHEQ